MGCDGGTIPRRDELVKTKSKTPPRDKSAERTAIWQNCAVSQLPLRAPVVGCRKGRLYNKEDLIKAILDKRAPKHIKKIKRDIRDLITIEHFRKGSASIPRIGCEAANLIYWPHVARRHGIISSVKRRSEEL